MDPREAHTYGKGPIHVAPEVALLLAANRQATGDITEGGAPAALPAGGAPITLPAGGPPSLSADTTHSSAQTLQAAPTAPAPAPARARTTRGRPPAFRPILAKPLKSEPGSEGPSSAAKTDKSPQKVVKKSTPSIKPLVNRLKQYRNKCAVCHAQCGDGLKVVAFIDDRHKLKAAYRKYGTITLSDDDTLCTSCVNVGVTVHDGMTSFQKICREALKRQPVTAQGRSAHFHEDYKENLCANLVDMYEQGRLCQTSLVSNDLKEFKIHGCVLAANTRKLDNELSRGSHIGLKDISEDGLKCLVQYLYTGELSLTPHLARQVLPYCQQWQLDWAGDRCKEVLQRESSKVKAKQRRTSKQQESSKDDDIQGEKEEGEIVYSTAKAIKLENIDEIPIDNDEERSGDDNDVLYDVTLDKHDVTDVQTDKQSQLVVSRKRKIKAEVGEKLKPPAPCVCTYCDRTFAREASLREHVLRIHEKTRPFMCEHCAHSTATRKDLQMHLRIKHHDKIDQAERAKFSCSTCGVTRGSLTQLRMHVARKHSTEKNCICEHCGMGFKTKGNLREHAKFMHDPQMQLKCTQPGCDRTLRGKFKLQEHIRRFHNNGEKRHKCHLCHYTTHYSHSLRSHYQGKHNMKMSYLTADWQAPHLKKKMFVSGTEELSEAPPYILESLAATTAAVPQAGGVSLHHPEQQQQQQQQQGLPAEQAPDTLEQVKYYPMENTQVQVENATFKHSDLLQSIVQNPEVNRILFEHAQQEEQQQATVTWEGQQYIQQISSNTMQLYTENLTDIQVAGSSMDSSIDKREQEAAVTLIAVGGKSDEVVTQQGGSIVQDGREYQVHVDSDNLYIVLPSVPGDEAQT